MEDSHVSGVINPQTNHNQLSRPSPGYSMLWGFVVPCAAVTMAVALIAAGKAFGMN